MNTNPVLCLLFQAGSAEQWGCGSVFTCQMSSTLSFCNLPLSVPPESVLQMCGFLQQEWDLSSEVNFEF